MPVGLSDGSFHEDYTTMVAMAMPIPKNLTRVPIVKDPEVSPGTNPGDYEMVVHPNVMGLKKELDQIELDPSSGLGVEIGFKRPLEGPTEPAGAFNSLGGSQVPGRGEKAELPDVGAPLIPSGGVFSKGAINPDSPIGRSGIGRQFRDFEARASEPVSDIKNFTDEDIQTAMKVAMGAGPGIIAGIKGLSALPSYAKGEALSKLGHAQVLEGQAANADDMWQQTGFFRGADGRWKYEIPDKDATLKESGFHKNIIPNDPRVGGEENITYSVKEGLTVGDVLEHSRLFEAYPFLKDIKIKEHTNKDSIGSANLQNKTLSFREDLDPEYLRGVLLHELQHFVQAHEGFATGANSRAFMPSKFDDAVELYHKAIEQGADPKSSEMIQAKKRIEEAFDIASEKYRRVMGEVEARNVQTRRGFNEVERHYKSPRSTEDRPRFVQINPENYVP